MIVLALSDCPAKLRGDLSKWLVEINTNVYVGTVSARVRERLWERICENVKNGQATMVYPDANEQKMSFKVHNTSWEIVDFDGVKLMRRPLPITNQRQLSHLLGECDFGFSKAATFHKIDKIQTSKNKNVALENYTVLDLETTGLSHLSDVILEIAALKVRNRQVQQEFHALIKTNHPIFPEIEKLTGLTTAYLQEKGIDLQKALTQLATFVGDDCLVCHNAAFDYKFLQVAYKKEKLTPLKNRCVDTLIYSKRICKTLPNYKLTTIAEFLGFDTDGAHRAIKDCYLTHGIYQKLNENST